MIFYLTLHYELNICPLTLKNVKVNGNDGMLDDIFLKINIEQLV